MRRDKIETGSGKIKTGKNMTSDEKIREIFDNIGVDIDSIKI